MGPINPELTGWLLAILAATAIFKTSKILAKKIPWMQASLIALPLGIVFMQGVLALEGGHEAAIDDLRYMNRYAIIPAIFPLGLEVVDFSPLKKWKFWVFLALYMTIPGVFLYWLNPNADTVLEQLAESLPAAAMSLAVLSIVLEENDHLYATELVKTLIMLGFVSDILLLTGVEGLKAAHNNPDVVQIMKSVLPQITVIAVSIGLVVLGRIFWWKLAIFQRIHPVLWLGFCVGLSLFFKEKGLSLALGSIMAGLIVPVNIKEHVLKWIRPFSSISMIVYMGTVGVKLHSVIEPQAWVMLWTFLLAVVAGKGVATLCGVRLGLFALKQALPVLFLIAGGGSMIVIVSGELLNCGCDLIREAMFQVDMLSAVPWAVIASLCIKKWPTLGEEEFQEEGELKPTFSYSES